MSSSTAVEIYFGPLEWFRAALSTEPAESLMEIVYRRDEARREIRVKRDGDVDEEPEFDPPDVVVAESGDFASLHEHVISNFVGLVHELQPARLILQNPPARVHTQLQRSFKPKVSRFEYPTVTLDILRGILDGYDDHVVGQAEVRDRVLAALYPLTKPTRTRPVVLMFYGPSGVGKTETAHFINGLLGGTLLRRQFSMFHSDKFASYLFGGSHSEPSFARDLLDRESGVVLIDEFDKANPVFHSAFYQLFDGGEFEDKNYNVQMGPAIIICTSNYKSEYEVREALGDALYSRFDALIPFEPLSGDAVRLILDKLIAASMEVLSEEEQSWITAELLRQQLGPVADRLSNVRQMQKLTQEVVSLQLVRHALQPGLS